MKGFSFILLLFPILCFSQTASNRTPVPSKPSSTDCPTWDDKNKPKSKAYYYRSLRSRKPVKVADTNKIKYSNSKPKAEPKMVPPVKPEVGKAEIKKDTVSIVKAEVQKDTVNGVGKAEVKEKEKEKKKKRLPPRKTTKNRKKKTTGCPNF